MRAREFITESNHSQQLNEALITSMLGGWLAGQAINWLKGKINKTVSSSIDEKIKEHEMLEYIDRNLAAVLGSHKNAIGSVLTSFAMNLIYSRGQPAQAAVNTVVGIAKKYVKEYTGVATAQSVAKNVGSSIIKGEADWTTIMQQLRRLEPIVDSYMDKWEEITDTDSKPQAPITNLSTNVNVAKADQDDPLAPYISGKNESIFESPETELAKRLPSLSKHNYNTIDKLMRQISKRHNITGKALHDLFVKKFKATPDNWIKNKLDEHDTVDCDLEDEVNKFVHWASKKLNLQKIPKIELSMDTEEAQEHHHTGRHTEGEDSVWVYAKNRNLVDILRTVFHELVHVRQGELGKIKPGSSYPGSPIEAEADMLAGKFIKIYGEKNHHIFQ